MPDEIKPDAKPPITTETKPAGGGESAPGDRRAADYAAHGDVAPWIPKFRLDEEATKRRQAEERIAKEFAPLAGKVTQLEAELATTRAAFAFDVVAVRVLDDEEDIAEFRDRYNRLPPGEDGKKPSPKEWFADLLKRHAEGKAPKWAQAYLPAKAVATADPGDEAEDDEEPAPRAKPKDKPAATRADEPDPNAGAGQGDAGASRRWTPDRLDRVSPTVVRQNHGTIVSDMAKAGLVIPPTRWEARRKRPGT